MEKKKQISVTFVLKEGMKFYCAKLDVTYEICKISDICTIREVGTVHCIFNMETKMLIQLIFTGAWRIEELKIKVSNKPRTIEQIPKEMIDKIPKVSLEEMKSNIELFRKSVEKNDEFTSKVKKPSEIRLSRDEWLLKLKNCWFEDIKNINSSNDFKGFM